MTRAERIAQIKGRRWDLEAPAQGYYVTCCRETVANKQCVRRMGHGLGGLFCRQHAKNNPEVSDEHHK